MLKACVKHLKKPNFPAVDIANFPWKITWLNLCKNHQAGGLWTRRAFRRCYGHLTSPANVML